MAMSLTTTMQLTDDDGSQHTPRPRRSTRDKRASQQFSNMTPSKRKRVEAEAALSDVDMPEVDVDDEDDYEAPRKFKPSTRGRGRGRGRGGGATPAASKRPRATKTASNSPTNPKTPGTVRRGRKAGGATTSGGRDLAEAKIQDDNALFSAIMNPAAALQTTVEDFLESFQQSQENALSDLINCVLRSCGSNDSVDGDRVVDYDGIVDALDDFTEALKEDEAPTYPLTSKHPMFKKFRKSLSEFLTRLIVSAAEMDILYTSDLLMTIQAWVVAMSSSQLRSFRHTATVIALEIETALCDVAAAVEKEAETLMRQREGEKKRKANNKSGAGAGGRDKDFEKKAAEVKERRTKLAEFLKEFFDGVFIHRYRDLDPHIRAECVSAMGSWLRLFPAHFLDGQYLRYIGWVLSDTNTSVRVEAVRSLVELYKKQDYIVSLQSFTERFKGRLVEMARGDTDLSVRVIVITVLGAIDSNGLLEDEQRAKLCLLIFDADTRVRKAVAGFVRGVWADGTESRLVGKRNPSDDETKKAGLKALTKLLLQWGKALDRESIAETPGDDEDGLESQEEGAATPALRVLLASPSIKSRLALATEALWDEIEVVADWEAMLDLLLLDHSALGESSLAGGGTPVSNKRRKGKKAREEVYEVDECWRLEESEETTLLECLLATITKAKTEAATGKKNEAEMADSDITRALIKALPSFITKHQTDAHRIYVVLQLAQLMNIEMYLEMRMISAYEALWDDINKQFLTHTSPVILTTSVALISILLATTSLSNTNNTKITALEDSLANSLRDLVGGREELEIASFEEDEARKMGDVLARMAALSGARDMTEWTEEEEGGNQSCAWDIVVALAERGRLGYREEEVMVERAMHFLMLHVIWKARRYMSLNVTGGGVESEQLEALQDSIREQRDLLLDRLVEYALGTQSNTLIQVRRAAFEKFLTIHILFSPPPTPPTATSTQPSQQTFPLTSLALSMSDELQYRCAGYVQAEIERYIDGLPEHEQHQDEVSGEESGSELETLGKEKVDKKAGKGKKAAEEVERPQSKTDLRKEYIFSTVLLCFLRAIRAGVVHIRHGTTILAHYGRLGVSFDVSARLIVEILREEGMYKSNGTVVVEVIVGALKQSQDHLLERLVPTPDAVHSLAKALVPALLVRGAQLAVVRRLSAQYVVEIHSSLISWATKEISAYVSKKNKRALVESIGFFKSLQTLLIGLEQADAMVINEHLDQQVRMLGLEVPTTAKTWEPLRAYERRLTNLSTKEKGAAKRSTKSKARDAGTDTEAAAQTSGDEDVEVEGLVEINAGISSQRTPLHAPATPEKHKTKLKPLPAHRSARASRASTPPRDTEDEEGDSEKSRTQSGRSSEVEQDEDDLEQTQRRSKKSRSANGFTNGKGSSEPYTPLRAPSRNITSPSKASARKRARSPDLDEDGEEMSNPAPESPAVASPPSIASQGEAFVVRKKRVRH